MNNEKTPISRILFAYYALYIAEFLNESRLTFLTKNMLHDCVRCAVRSFSGCND